MQNKIRALSGMKRVGNQTSLICTSFSSAFFACSFIFLCNTVFLPLRCCILSGSIPVLFQARTIPHHAVSLSDPIQAYGFNCHLGTADSPPRHCSLALGLCIPCCVLAPDFHLYILQASRTQPVQTHS